MSLTSCVGSVIRTSGCFVFTLIAALGAQPTQGHAQAGNGAISAGMTCAELLALTKTGDKQTLGIAILWLDGVYAGRTGADTFPAGFAMTLGQGAGGNCAIAVNGARLVIDIIADIHKQFDKPQPAK